MTDPELRRTLAALHPPTPSDSARSRALFRATLALDSSARSPAPVAERRNRFVRLSAFPALPALTLAAAA
ncbi:MAG: hypothetical protein H7067_03585, partial [Burkholderiales bacterium]|nr:hypothetical protein [Opitutaceae bacterium]